MEERIRVAVRIRPENVDKVSVCQSDVDKNVITINSESANNKSDEHSFKFDRVYNKESNQEAIFEDVKGLVMSSLDGYNATIFAFGMTGSGKTHTISGNSKDPGIVPRSIELIFSEIEKRSLINPTEICIPYLSCIELYNNVLYDLLEKPIAFSNNINTSTSASGFSGNYKQSVLKLFEHPIKGVTVTGTKTIRTPVTCAKEAMELIQMANNRRSVDCTNCNDRSSRSHCVYKLEFLCHEKKHSVNVDTGRNSDSNEKVNSENEVDSGLNADDAFNEAVCVFGTDSHTLIKHSCINFVDLAGSENVKVSGATGGTLEEAKQINKALAILGDVLNALSRNSLSAKAVNTSVSSSVDSAVASKYNRPTTTFIPYRSSKLTMLLKDSLGGNSKTMMIATIRPTMRDYYQSLTTLRYAARTRDITCTPRLNVTIHTDSKMVPRNEKNKEQEKHMQAILDEVALLKSNLAAQQIEYDSLQQQKEELNKLVNSFRQNENHDGNKQQLDLELLFEKNELETMKLKEKLQNIIEIQDMKLIEQAKEYQTNLALERKHVSKTMLELTKEKANIQSELSNTNKYVIPDLLSKIEDLEKRNIDLNNQNSELQIEMKQVLENCGEEQKMWEEYALIGYEKEKSEFLAMLDKVNASRNKYKGIASQLEKELQTKDQLLYEYQTKLQEQTIRKVVTVGINTEQKKDPYVNIIDKNIDVTQWDEYEQLKNELQLKNDRILTLESQLDSSLSLNKLFEDSSTNQSTEHMLELESLNKTLKQDLAASRGKESKLENLVRKLSVNMEKLKAEIFHDHDNLSKLQEDCIKKDDQIALLRCENEKIDTKYHEYVKLSKNELEDLNSKILEINRKNADSKTQMQLDFDKQINGKHACIDHLKQDLIILENKYKKIEFEFSSYRESNEVCMEKICRTISGECAFVLNDCISRIIEDSDRRKSGSWDINDDVVGLVEEVHPLKCPSTEKGDSLRDDEIISEPGLGVDIGVQIDIDKDANVALFADRDVGVGYLSSPVSSSESQQRRIETLEGRCILCSHLIFYFVFPINV